MTAVNRNTQKGDGSLQSSEVLRETYSFIMSVCVSNRKMNNNNISLLMYRDLSREAVDAFVRSYNKAHVDQIELDDRERERIARGLEDAVKKLDAMVSREITSYASESGMLPQDVLLNTDLIQDRLKIEDLGNNNKRAIESLFSDVIEGFRKQKHISSVEASDFRNAFRDLIRITKGKDERDEGESYVAKVGKREDRTGSALGV